MPTYTASSTIRQRKDTDTLVVSWAEYISQIEYDLHNSYWKGDETEVEVLRQRLNIARCIRERDGGDHYISF